MVTKIGMRKGVSAGVLLLLAVSGCSEKEQGYAQAQGLPDDSSGDMSAVVPTSTDPVPTSSIPISSELDPCGLLLEEDLAEAGRFDSEYKEGDGARSCYWQNSFENGGDGFTFAVSLRDSQSVEEMNDNGAGVQRIEVNQRPAAVSKNAEFGSCTVAMKLDDVSRVDVAVPRTEEDDACEIAEVIAGLVEPHLPEIP